MGAFRRTLMLGKKNNVLSPHNLGDICYWNGSALAYVPYTQWSSSLGTPLAVCVIPSSHASIWGDGQARFMSIKGVNSDGSESSSEEDLVWSDTYFDAGLTKCTQVPIWDNTIGGSISTSDYGYISSTKFTGTENVIDKTTKYYDTSGSNMIPSPYASDDGFYNDYKRVISGNNALGNLDGKINTTTIATTFYYRVPAARACYLYSTNGIAAGEWYLPACGELAYIMPRFKIINNALSACSGILLKSSRYYWSSTEYNKDAAYYIYTKDGTIDYYGSKTTNRYVRPFVSLP